MFRDPSAARLGLVLATDARDLLAAPDWGLPQPRGVLDLLRARRRVSAENRRLRAELEVQLEEVKRSRSRIVAAADAERRRIERNLHDGAQQRLLTLALQVRMLGDAVAEDPRLREMTAGIEMEALGALDELRELAQGMLPSILADEGLRSAIEFLAERSPLPVDLDVVEGRFPEQVEATVYFVVAEALANVGKYANASRARIRVTGSGGMLRVSVSDDGVGGADPARGSGLCGLEDRVSALDGRLRLRSGRGRGTTLAARIPISAGPRPGDGECPPPG